MTQCMRNKLVNYRPASFCYERWKDGTPLGNGEMGAMVLGGIRDEEMILTRHDLWDWGITDPLPDIHETLQQSREAIDRGDYDFAARVHVEALQRNGYMTDVKTLAGMSSPFPLGTLKMTIGKGVSFYHYKRILDMEHGILSLQYDLKKEGCDADTSDKYHCTREVFVSGADHVTVYHIHSEEKISAVEISINLTDLTPPNAERCSWMREYFAKTLKCYEKDGLLYYGYKFWQGQQAGAVIRIVSDGEIRYDGCTAVVTGAKEITVLVKSFTGTEEDFNPTAEYLKTIPYSYDELRQRQAEQFADIYNRSNLFLAEDDSSGYDLSNEELIQQAYDDCMSPEFVEKLYNFGRYMFISATSPDLNPCPLVGLWACDYDLAWPWHLVNENVQLIYWHINVGGLADYGKSLVHYFYKKIPQMQENARKLWGCRGIMMSPCSSPIDSTIATMFPYITNWTSGAGWMCRHFYDYYRYTGDEELFLQEILPIMVETAAFYEDFICYDENGKMKYYPSVSPENSPFSSRENIRGHNGPLIVVKNSTMDFAIMKEVLTNLIKECTVRQLYAEKCEIWQEILDRIPAYQINEDGAVKEWMSEDLKDFYAHRHISHIYPVFPGEEITKDSDKALYHAFEKAVDLREIDGQCGWSMVHKSAIYSRFGKSEAAMDLLDMVPKACLTPSFITLGGDYRGMGLTFYSRYDESYQIDVLLGYVNAVQELLFCYRNGTLMILPACPKRLKKGHVENFCFPGGKADFSWNKETNELNVTIKMEYSEMPKIVIPKEWENPVINWENS